MGWGCYYPSAPVEPPARSQTVYTCEGRGCDFETTDGDRIAGPCCRKTCGKWNLCEGCAYECADCELNFCRQHIIEIPTANRGAIYRCEGCCARLQQEAA